MKHKDGSQFLSLGEKRLCLIGMSGVGKSHLSNMLRRQGWYHYSVDYRLGTRYLGEEINDEIRRLAAQLPAIARLLSSASIQLDAKVQMNDLSALSFYIGKPGSACDGWLPEPEFLRRQTLHVAAEIAATKDHRAFIAKAADIYGCKQFVCDTSGSLCSIVNPADEKDPVLTDLAETSTIVHIDPDEEDLAQLIEAFQRSPKPIFYSEPFFYVLASKFSAESGDPIDSFNGDEFSRWAFARLIDMRAPLYRSITRNWGYSITAKDARRVQTQDELLELIAHAIDDENH
ncbi:MAG TPA: hypothetical protein VGC14_21985 [Rhizobium sp.]